MIRQIGATTVALLCAARAECAPPDRPLLPRDIVGIYSDMYYVPEEGDVVGMELHLVYSRNGYFVLYQEAEGSLGTPVLVKAIVDGDRIEFVLPADRGNPEQKFVGVFSPPGLVGSFGNGRIDVRGKPDFQLTKGPGYWGSK